MNIEQADKEILKAIKKIVEKIELAGVLPKTLEGLQELYFVWNTTYKRNEKLTNCPSCRQTKFIQLKRTYDLYNLKDEFNRKKVTEKKTPAKKKSVSKK